MQRETAAKQDVIEKKQDVLDKTYLRGVFEMGEALWALGHIKGMGPGPDDNALQRLRADAKQLSAESGSTLDGVLQRYKLSLQLIDVSSEIISEFDDTLKLVPASDWTRTLRRADRGRAA